MGFSGVSMGSLLLILLIVMVIFGTKRIRNIGEDLGAAVKGFRQGMADAEQPKEESPVSHSLKQESESNV